MRSKAIAGFLSLLCCWGSLAHAQSKGVVVLVPGFFNSLLDGYVRENPKNHLEIRPYFSLAIVQTVESEGYKAEVVENLSPLGDLETNGAILARELALLQNKHRGEPMTLVAHSAGGLYVLAALQQHPELISAIRNVVTMSTPYEGVALVDRATWIPGIESLAKFLSLKSLVDLEGGKVAAFLRSHSFPSQVRWVAVGAYEPSCKILWCGNPQNLSSPLSLAQVFIGEKSDGIVGLSSSLATHSQLPIERWTDLVLPLEHWELVQDARMFSILGVGNLAWIQKTQDQVYRSILRRL